MRTEMRTYYFDQMGQAGEGFVSDFEAVPYYFYVLFFPETSNLLTIYCPSSTSLEKVVVSVIFPSRGLSWNGWMEVTGWRKQHISKLGWCADWRGSAGGGVPLHLVSVFLHIRDHEFSKYCQNSQGC